MKKQNDNWKLRCLERDQEIEQLKGLLKDKQVLVNELHAEKRFDRRTSSIPSHCSHLDNSKPI